MKLGLIRYNSEITLQSWHYAAEAIGFPHDFIEQITLREKYHLRDKFSNYFELIETIQEQIGERLRNEFRHY
jgi:hypothetical protein